MRVLLVVMMLIVMALGFGLELLLFVPAIWAFRRVIGIVLLGVLIGQVGYGLTLSGWLAAASILGVVRIVHIARVFPKRHEPQHLYGAMRRTTYWLGGMTMVVGGLVWLLRSTSMHTIALGAGLVTVLTAIGICVVTNRNIARSVCEAPAEYFADRELPSISLCVPARNETAVLEEFLHSALASDYPKLEIIVLDDNSHDTTPQIIRSFVHGGVRFVQGDEPGGDWLAKNYAYQRLFEESSGKYVVFCGVDIRFTPESLRRLITGMLQRNEQMISIMPQRFTDSVAGAFVQPMRYWWELALPRDVFGRPPVLSSLWIASRDILASAGGFGAVRKSVVPEGYFARRALERDGYDFWRSDAYLGVQTVKSVAEQRATTVRVRYPQIHKRFELAVLLLLAECLLLIGPFVGLFVSVWHGWFDVALMFGGVATFLVVTHVRIVAVSSPPSVPIALLNFPLAVCMELLLSLLSMVRYEFYTVVWKARVIVPRRQLEVINKLPPIY